MKGSIEKNENRYFPKIIGYKKFTIVRKKKYLNTEF